MAVSQTFTCDNCGSEIDPENVITVQLVSKAVPSGVSVKHLDGACEDDFMDGSLTGEALFLTD